MDKIYTSLELIERFGYSLCDSSQMSELSSLVTMAKKYGIGNPVTFQKTVYTDDDISKIEKLFSWWKFLFSNSMIEYRDRHSLSSIQKVLCSCVSKNVKLTIYAVYCPSYKKGLGEVGYTGVVGKHTNKLIREMVNFVYNSKGSGIDTCGEAFFSDLLLENFDKLKGTQYKEDLMLNYEDFKKIFRDNDQEGLISVKLLSEVGDLRSGLGEVGIQSSLKVVPDDIFELVNKRNEVFYMVNLGWTKDVVLMRSRVLSSSYAYMGREFRTLYPNGLMFWTESAYERGRLYHGLDVANPLPIIYPPKSEF
jgi:hypothetical protein